MTRLRRSSIVLAVIVGAFVLVVVLVAAPALLVRHDMQGRVLTAAEYLKAINDARVLILQAVAGTAVAIGAWATWRRMRISEDELRATRDGQITDRFTRAVEQLGSEKVDIRIGAVAALARIAATSPTDRDAIVTALSAYARSHAPWPPRAGAEAQTDDLPTLAARAGDVQAVVSALGGMPVSSDGEKVRLSHTDLRRARMWQLRFDRANFGGANLSGARLGGSSCVGADFGFADLRDVQFANADLSSALLWGADLRGADLSGADLTGAEADAATRWPDGLDADARGVMTTNPKDRARIGRER